MRKKYGKRDTMILMLRQTTADESHSKALTVLVEGAPVGFPLTIDDVSRHLARRRFGYGCGARMKFEVDEATLLTGIRHGETLGAPIGIMVGNPEWPKWTKVMSADPVDPTALSTARGATLTRPHLGHADFNGILKYNHIDARNILECSSAHETAARAATSVVARSILRETFGVEAVSHVVSIGCSGPYEGPLPTSADQDKTDESLVRVFFAAAEESMIVEIKAVRKQGDTLGGIVEVVVHGLSVGLGSHISGDTRLDSQLADALMGIQSVKGAEIDDGFEEARHRGTGVHNEMVRTDDGVDRETSRTDGLEDGMTNAQPPVVYAVTKPISTVLRVLKAADMANGGAATVIHQRSDVCAVPAGSVIVEAMAVLALVRAVMEKFGGDSLEETKCNVEGYLEQARCRLD